MATKACAESASEPGSIEKRQSVADKYLALRKSRQEDVHETWKAYWKLRDIETRGSIYPRIQYWSWKMFDVPVTWWRVNVTEPLNNRYRRPYFHRKVSRVPYVDECQVHDFVCIHEANDQFRRDKMVDEYIMDILDRRRTDCIAIHNGQMDKCVLALENYEEAELNFFIKYGEIGGFGDVRDCYFKQKHRMVWERRHPEIMEEREQKLAEHKEKLAQGEFDTSFWKRHLVHQDKTRYIEPYEYFRDKGALMGDRPTSKDWEYYKRRQQDPEYDAQERRREKPPQSNVPLL